MGKPTGFLEYARAVPNARPPADRIGDWRELHEHLEESSLRDQGARCMDCGVPFCHTGRLIDGSAAGCPIHNLIPEWNDLVYRGNWREALRRLLHTNNFPEFTGRVCPAPCEGSCVLGINAPPVTIKSIEAAIIEKGFEEGWVVPERPAARTGRRVGVVGSGPAGLACAAQLNRAGHAVTVFERADRVGGLLMYGIPNMKLDKSVVLRRVRLMEQEGIRFLTNTEVGKDLTITALRQDCDAIVLCTGAGTPRELNVEGRALGGVHFAMEFLHANTKRLLDGAPPAGGSVSARDKDVVVVGGGDTGTDCVATALRHGCRSVAQVEILPKPPIERAPDNPWPQWPRIYRVDYGQEEAWAVQGSDPRRYSTTTRRLVGDAAGQVAEVHTVGVEWVEDERMRRRMREVPGTEAVLPAQLVLLAMGFLGPERQTLLADLDLELDGRGNVRTDDRKATSVPGVFAAGDMARGQSLVVWAIAEGRQAARGVDQFLMGRSILP
jgi:glutamate synthase (NADPH/NADH) small chain